MINKSLLVAERPLKVRVGKLTDNQVKLVLSDNQIFEVSRKYLPESAKLGDELYLNLIAEEDFDKTKKEIAKELLEQILAKDDEK
jgi:hypothetical protein